MRTVSRLLMLLGLLFLGWRILTWLKGVHSLLLLIAFLAFSLNTATVWLIRTTPLWIAGLCRYKAVQSYVGFVCWCMGREQPTTSDPDVRGRLQLRTQAEFRTAADQAKQLVRGHNHVIDGMLDRIRENHTLARSRRRGGAGPLASFLLVGREGVGKRYLLRVLAKLLFRGGCVDVFNCKRVTPAYLIGSKAQPGKLVEILTSRPGAVLLFESIEDASPPLREFLIQLVSTGQLPGPTGIQSLERCVIALSTCRLPETYDSENGTSPSDVPNREMARVLIEDLGLDRTLVGAVTETFGFATPGDRVRAEVVALLMKKECSDHRVNLAHVDAEILAMQVVELEDDIGFGLAPQRVRKLLRRPLVAIEPTGQKTLALRLTSQFSLSPKA